MENKRKLASIQRISQLTPISGADRIEVAQVQGWKTIVKKGEFNVGDLGVFFEIDSFLPASNKFSFLGEPKDYIGFKGHRLKTMRMRGVISQGLMLPISSFPELPKDVSEGTDVTELLGVIKYDNSNQPGNHVKSPGLRAGQTAGKFPSFIPKTDQERIQNLLYYWEVYKDSIFEETLKLDGSSLTAFKVKQELTIWQKLMRPIRKLLGLQEYKSYYFGVCSRNLEIKPDDNYQTTFDNKGKPSEYKQSDFWYAARKYELEQKLPVGYALQGELIGPRIQSNHERVNDLEFYVFDIWDIHNQKYLPSAERLQFVKSLGIPHVPFVGYTKIFQECKNLDELLERVEGESMNPNTISEGRVYKHIDIPDITFKCISNSYLLKCEA